MRQNPAGKVSLDFERLTTDSGEAGATGASGATPTARKWPMLDPLSEQRTGQACRPTSFAAMMDSQQHDHSPAANAWSSCAAPAGIIEIASSNATRPGVRCFPVHRSLHRVVDARIVFCFMSNQV